MYQEREGEGSRGRYSPTRSGILAGAGEDKPHMKYLPDVADTLNNLGLLYANTHRTEAAKDAYTEALRVRINLVKANPTACGDDLSETLRSLLHVCATPNQERRPPSPARSWQR